MANQKTENAPKRIIEESDTPEMIVSKIANIRAKRRDHLGWPELFVLEGYDWQKGLPLDRKSPDYASVKARQDQLTETDRDLSMKAWGRELRAEFPEYLGSGSVRDVLAECKTPQQKARLILRQAGSELDHQWYEAPEFQAFVAEVRRIADTPKGTTTELVPNDIYTHAIGLTRAYSSEPRTLKHAGEEVGNGSHMISEGMNNFISSVVKAGLAETSGSRRPSGSPNRQQGIEHPTIR